jgi:hypothetical protein
VSYASYLEVRKSGDVYSVTNNYGHYVTGKTLELALIKAIQQAGIEGVELAPTLQAAEVLESLLGANE